MFANLQLVTPQKVNPAAQESGTVSCPDRSQLIQNRRADVGGPPFVSSDQGVRWGSPMPQSDYAHNCESTNVIVARNRDSPSVRTWRLKYETIVLWAKLGVNVVLFLDLAYGDEQSRVWLAKDLLHNVVLEKVSLEVIAKIVPAFAGIARANGGYMLRNFEERLVHETKEAFKLIWTIQTMAHGNSQIKGTPIFAIVKRGHLLTELLIVFYRQHILQDRYLRECLQFLFDTIPNNSRLEAMTKLIAGVQPVTLTTRSWLPTFCRNLVGKYRLTNGTSKFSAIQDACSAKWSPF
ncbi:hypothetical protein E1B28_007629 [Marasmius oreades]|uniref:Uncharacterized protein n=1 Tax=Marasmius oreades TaxID=181124 RepID=A0A9P7S2P9_9AGAR|nr:uncharacterized protein E1B28_007629 [Marasmius oreades]KAG7094000.1 hypothetical protein E1B28_007629 [Marasmius oreades]